MWSKRTRLAVVAAAALVLALTVLAVSVLPGAASTLDWKAIVSGRAIQWLAANLMNILLALHLVSLVAPAWLLPPVSHEAWPWTAGLLLLSLPAPVALYLVAGGMFPEFLRDFVYPTWRYLGAAVALSFAANYSPSTPALPSLVAHFRRARLALALFMWAVVVVWVTQTNEPYTFRYEPPADYVPTPLCAPDKHHDHDASFRDAYSDYTRLHARVLAGPPGEFRAVVFVPQSGLGNVLQGLVSTFLLAMLTDRAFLVHWDPQGDLNANLDDLFQEPGFKWNAKKTAIPKLDTSWEWLLGYCRSCPFRSRPVVGGITDRMLCHPTIGLDPDVPVWKLTSTNWYGSIMAHNPAFRQRICALTGPDIFGTIARMLLRPSPAVQELINQVKAHVGTDPVVSVQLRRHEVNAMPLESEQIFFSCASALAATNTTKIFLASDSNETRERWRHLLGNRLVTLPAADTGNEGMVSRGSVSGMQLALADMFLLGDLSDDMVITPFSTFGYVAHGRASIIPHVVTRDNFCMRALSSQPCSMYWFGVTMSPCFDPHVHLTSDMLNQHDCYL